MAVFEVWMPLRDDMKPVSVDDHLIEHCRERTGVPSVVDVSLLGLALWNLSIDVASAKLFPERGVHRDDRENLINPTVGMYPTKDGRYLNLTMPQSEPNSEYTRQSPPNPVALDGSPNSARVPP